MSDFEMDLDFNQAVKPKPRLAVPAGVYPFVIENYRVEDRSGWKIVTMFHQVEGGEYDGRVIFHDIFMPNREKQEPDKYNESLGRIQEYLESIMGSPVTGSIRFNPGALIGARGQMEVGVRRDKIEGEAGKGPQGEQLYYDPRNTIKRIIPQGTVAAPAQVAQPFQLPTQAPLAQQMQAPPVQPMQPMAPPMQFVPPVVPPIPTPAPTPSAPQPVAPAAQMAPVPAQQPTPAPSPSEQTAPAAPAPFTL